MAQTLIVFNLRAVMSGEIWRSLGERQNIYVTLFKLIPFIYKYITLLFFDFHNKIFIGILFLRKNSYVEKSTSIQFFHVSRLCWNLRSKVVELIVNLV